MICAKRFATSALLAVLAACTPGGIQPSTSGGGGGGGVPLTGTIVRVTVNLTEHPSPPLPLPLTGPGGGFSPNTIDVHVGDQVIFTNSDSFAHTASFIGMGTSFPRGSPFGISALTRSGSALSQGWTSGQLNPSDSSQPIVVNAPGTYLYGCFFHFNGGMRGMIVAQ
jgi:plastocyanin